ncbi:MAG: zinc-binding dehydrogenase [Alphaproteobacteria bacterium]
MKAAVIERQGGVENIVYRHWPDPEIAPDEVLLKVEACALNYLDLEVRRGMPGMAVPMPFISGGDMAGVIEAVGNDVTTVSVGDRIVFDPVTRDGMMGEEVLGGLADYAKAPAANAIPIPDAVSFNQAAALPVAYGAGHKMIERAAVTASDLVVVLGAAGGVGLACVQIAKQLGATVIAVSSSDEKLERLVALGADHGVNSAIHDFSREVWAISGKRGADVAVNYIGGETWTPTLRCLGMGGRLVTCGASAGFDPKTDIRYIWRRQLNIMGSNGWTPEGIRWLLDQVASGGIEAVIDSVHPLSDIQTAQTRLETRQSFGKVILHP